MKIPLPVRGVDLMSAETRLEAGYARAADNVDIDADGSVSRRPGYTRLVSGDDWHSLHATKKAIYYGRGNELRAVHPDTLGTALLFDMGGDGLLDFTEYNGHLYVVSPTAFVWVPADEAYPRRVGVLPPQVLPGVAPAAAGNLDPGTYAVALSRVDDRGEESQTRLVGTVDLPTGGGVQLTDIQADPTCTWRVYLSPANGDMLYLAEEFIPSLSTYLVGTIGDGAMRTTQHLRPMSPGDFVRWHAGRLLVAAGNVLHFSQPLRPHLTDPRHDHVSFVGRIRFIEPVTGGIFVGDDRGVWFLDGTDPGKQQLIRASSRLAVRRSSIAVPGRHFDPDRVPTDQNVAVWLSEGGYMVGLPDGGVIALHPERVIVAADLEGRSALVLRDGERRIITLVAATTTRSHGVAFDTSLT
jgi:hypothetical protein